MIIHLNKIVLASDHAGFSLKTALIHVLKQQGHDIVDLGTHNEEKVDYPDYAASVAEHLRQDPEACGIAICGSGIGMDIALNRYSHIRASLCQDVTSSRLGRQHNDANVLVLGSRLIGIETALDCVKIFLSTPFEGGRHRLRLEKITNQKEKI